MNSIFKGLILQFKTNDSKIVCFSKQDTTSLVNIWSSQYMTTKKNNGFRQKMIPINITCFSLGSTISFVIKFDDYKLLAHGRHLLSYHLVERKERLV
ncbi:hypothetical protein HanIR_Chr16g0815451 [Helianthus annuus]|nr:hypothetical protein HanIR_Chr16g0815451 [Helianthus annuus]